MRPATTEVIHDHQGSPIGYIRRQVMTVDEATDLFGERFLATRRGFGPARGYFGPSEWKKRQEDEDTGRTCPLHRDLATY